MRRLIPVGAALLFLSGLLGCGESSDHSMIKSIIDEDDRKPSTHSAVGGFFSKDFCTAFAVSEDEIVTANHCYDEDVGGWFTLGDESYIVTDTVEIVKKSDYIRLKIDGELSNWLEVTDSFYDEGTILSFDRHTIFKNSGSLFQVISDDKVLAGHIVHNMDSVPGSSGSPILNNEGKVFAIHLGAVSDEDFNYGIILSERHKVDSRFVAVEEEAVPAIIFGAVAACARSIRCTGAALSAGYWIVDKSYEQLDKYLTMTRAFRQEVEMAKMKHGFDMEKAILDAQLACQKGECDKKIKIELVKPPSPSTGSTSGGGTGPAGSGGPSSGSVGGQAYQCSWQTMKAHENQPGRFVVTHHTSTCYIHLDSAKDLTNREYLGLLLGGSVYSLLEEQWTAKPLPTDISELFQKPIDWMKAGLPVSEVRKKTLDLVKHHEPIVVADRNKKEKEKEKWYEPGCKFCREP
ncbi:MAG: trypsin-like serine peptidase [Oligoflexus sp.]